MSRVVIGMDPHKRSVTIEVMAPDETVLDSGHYATDGPGYAALLRHAKQWPDRVWAVEGCSGTGRHVATRLLADGEQVVDVPPKLSARVRVFSTAQGRKTDDTDAYAVAVAGLRGRGLELVQPNDTAMVFKLLSDRRQQLVEQRIATVNRLHQLIQELLPGGASKRLTAKKARELLSTVRPRQTVAKTRKALALEQLADLEHLDVKLKQMQTRIAEALKEHPSHVEDVFGLGAVTTAVILGEVGGLLHDLVTRWVRPPGWRVWE
jgi:transposase